jgi:hypothetical protein
VVPIFHAIVAVVVAVRESPTETDSHTGIGTGRHLCPHYYTALLTTTTTTTTTTTSISTDTSTIRKGKFGQGQFEVRVCKNSEPTAGVSVGVGISDST